MNSTNYEVPHCGAFSTPHSHPPWVQMFVSGSCFQITFLFPTDPKQDGLATWRRTGVRNWRQAEDRVEWHDVVREVKGKLKGP